MTIEIQTEDNLQYQYYPVSSGSVQFSVQASNDAHICLTSGPKKENPMIEIFIGGWNNTKSAIRRNRVRPGVVEYEEKDLLNASEFRDFWVRWDDGTIQVGRQGQSSGFMSWKDPEHFHIKYIGVATGWGATGTWKIDDKPEFRTPDNEEEYKFIPIVTGYLEFEYKGSSSCFVNLTGEPWEVDHFYEINLGTSNNTQTIIKRGGENNKFKASFSTPKLVDRENFKRFLIQWSSGRVYVRNASTPRGDVIAEITDPKPFPITHFGIRTGHGASGQWRINHYDSNIKSIVVNGNLAGESGVWVKASKGKVPENAVKGGVDSNKEPLYIARARHGDALVPGKLAKSHGGAFIAFGGKEHMKTDYEVLVGGTYNWVLTSGKLIPKNAFPAGESETGEPQYVGRVMHLNSLTLGKVHPEHGACYIPYDKQEHRYTEYEILVV